MSDQHAESAFNAAKRHRPDLVDYIKGASGEKTGHGDACVFCALPARGDDEGAFILHRARLSPVKHSQALTDDELRRLHDATRAVLAEWIERLRTQAGEGFPEGVTAFRPEMAVHGRYGKPCPDCGAPVQRIVYADNETNYCARCQTGGRMLADRSLSRLLHADWPRTLDEWEARRGPAG